MAIEIERRFLVRKDIRSLCRDGLSIVQGYLPSDDGRTVRVRVAGPDATLTVKSPRRGPCREEVEHPLPLDLALGLLRHSCRGGLIEKTRYLSHHHGLCWEIDVFGGENAGLVIAEVELSRPDQLVPLPDWVGAEVTNRAAYSNSSLARSPIRGWASAA
ncbi:CYTH domain-containing protein [Azospirillum isscasi]|uniref:CYTH domain-containing protein n=1 Tax=Azospirillum isscasi TaxID=3053926 RepID=A0ABU0WCG5_9PROT|nr:CYTH domain-containing protein [Azospirillum isscasi]MDQ2101879.1 CYTH domain-containing protein [Azospirillum isscasi]